jgi:alanyl-tRNA synthetase
MSTERLYFADPYLRAFAARVIARADRGGRPTVALDRTAFYPEGGGQPTDHGTLDGARVIDVQSDDAGLVWHVLDRRLARDEVQGEVDWPRRFDHIQQHHGQHLLSAAFEELFGLPTLAFHLGAEYSSIDLPGEVPEDRIEAAERRANEVIWEDRPVVTRIVMPEELATIPLRKPPVVEGPVRIVSVPDFDHSACGGTHPRSTGAVGLLHVSRRERRGAETRVEFLCGRRALDDLRRKSGLVSRLASDLSVGAGEIEEAVQRIREHESAGRKRLATAMEQLLRYEALELVAWAPRAGKLPLVHTVRHDLSMDDGRLLASAIVKAGGVVVIGLRGDKAQLLVAAPATAGVDCNAVVRAALEPVGGRGGGQPAMAQGGVPDPAQLEATVLRAIDLITVGIGQSLSP